MHQEEHNKENGEIKQENEAILTCSLCEGSISLSYLPKHVLEMHGLILKSRIINTEES